jgi:hypothetical protein
VGEHLGLLQLLHLELSLAQLLEQSLAQGVQVVALALACWWVGEYAGELVLGLLERHGV